MRSRRVWTIVVLGVLVMAAVILFLARFSLSALEAPGPLETSIASKARRFFIRRASRTMTLPVPRDKKAAIAEGDTLYGIDCSMCHGRDGRGATDMGRWMYPRAADLTSADAQSYSNRELFWTIKNGIRLSGMPGFGKVESDEHILDLVYFLRSLARSPQSSGEPR